MDVFVTGGTGAIGREAVKALVGAGHTVRALARSEEKAWWLFDQGAEPVEVSLFDEDALAAAFEGHQAVRTWPLRCPRPANSSFRGRGVGITGCGPTDPEPS